MSREENIKKSIAILDNYRDEISEDVYNRVLNQIDLYSKDDTFLDEKAIKGIIKMETYNSNLVKYTDEQIYLYDFAQDVLRDIEGIFFRQSTVVEDEGLKKIYDNRRHEIANERQKLDIGDDELARDIIDTYKPLVDEYFSLGGSKEEIAQKGLPERLWTTKVDFSKYGK